MIAVFLVKLTPKRWAESYINIPINEDRDLGASNPLMNISKFGNRRMSKMVEPSEMNNLAIEPQQPLD